MEGEGSGGKCVCMCIGRGFACGKWAMVLDNFVNGEFVSFLKEG